MQRGTPGNPPSVAGPPGGGASAAAGPVPLTAFPTVLRYRASGAVLYSCVKGETMPRPVTLFTGQWADLPLATLAEKVAGWGFDGLELACWGDHFDVAQALSDDGYVRRQREILERHGLKCLAISNHLVGQCVCDPIDARHQGILPPRIWGDGDPEGVRQRAAEEIANTARAAKLFGVDVVNGFTGSSVW